MPRRRDICHHDQLLHGECFLPHSWAVTREEQGGLGSGCRHTDCQLGAGTAGTQHSQSLSTSLPGPGQLSSALTPGTPTTS